MHRLNDSFISICCTSCVCVVQQESIPMCCCSGLWHAQPCYLYCKHSTVTTVADVLTSYVPYLSQYIFTRTTTSGVRSLQGCSLRITSGIPSYEKCVLHSMVLRGCSTHEMWKLFACSCPTQLNGSYELTSLIQGP